MTELRTSAVIAFTLFTTARAATMNAGADVAEASMRSGDQQGRGGRRLRRAWNHGAMRPSPASVTIPTRLSPRRHARAWWCGVKTRL